MVVRRPQFISRKTSPARGFTLVELVVTMGIFVLMLGIALSNYNQFSRDALFANDAEGVGLALREAQIYGTGVRASGSSFDVAYGVHFDTANQSGYLIFADNDKSGTYNTPVDEIVRTVKFSSAAKITNISCGMSSCSGNIVDITFRRPSPDARMRNNGNNENSLYEESSFTISNGSKTAVTTITRAGQISVTSTTN